MLEMPYCNADSFQIFINTLANQDLTEYKIVVLDNGAFHHAKALKIPENMTFVFLPPYSPELNPAEKIWATYKRAFTNRIHKTLDELSRFISEVIKTTTKNSIISTCSFSYIFENSLWIK